MLVYYFLSDAYCTFNNLQCTMKKEKLINKFIRVFTFTDDVEIRRKYE